jgi:hypothetical protein
VRTRRNGVDYGGRRRRSSEFPFSACAGRLPGATIAPLAAAAIDSLCCSCRFIPSPLHIIPIFPISTLRNLWATIYPLFRSYSPLLSPPPPPPSPFFSLLLPTLTTYSSRIPSTRSASSPCLAHICVIGSCSQQQTTYHPDNTTLPSKPRRIVQLFRISLASTVSSSSFRAPRSTAIIRCHLRG